MEVGRLRLARAVGFLAGYLNGVVVHLKKDQVDLPLPSFLGWPSTGELRQYWLTFNIHQGK